MDSHLEPFHGIEFYIWDTYFVCAAPITLCVFVSRVLFFIIIMLSSTFILFFCVLLLCVCVRGRGAPWTLLLSWGVALVLGCYSYPWVLLLSLVGTLVLGCHSCLSMLAYLLGESMTCMLVWCVRFTIVSQLGYTIVNKRDCAKATFFITISGRII